MLLHVAPSALQGRLTLHFGYLRIQPWGENGNEEPPQKDKTHANQTDFLFVSLITPHREESKGSNQFSLERQRQRRCMFRFFRTCVDICEGINTVVL